MKAIFKVLFSGLLIGTMSAGMAATSVKDVTNRLDKGKVALVTKYQLAKEEIDLSKHQPMSLRFRDGMVELDSGRTKLTAHYRAHVLIKDGKARAMKLSFKSKDGSPTMFEGRTIFTPEMLNGHRVLKSDTKYIIKKASGTVKRGEALGHSKFMTIEDLDELLNTY